MNEKGEGSVKYTRTSNENFASLKEELLEAVLCNNVPKIRQVIEQNDHLLSFTYPEYNKRILLIACFEDGVNAETVGTLLSLNANPEDCNENDGWTALHLAASKTDYNILDVLLEHNPENVNVTDKLGRNVLHILICYGSRVSTFFRCAELLVKKGVDVQHEDSNGKTPLYCANENNVGQDLKKIIESVSGKKVLDQASNNHEEKDGAILVRYLIEKEQLPFVEFKNGQIGDLVNYSNGKDTLLQMCCQMGLDVAAWHLVKNGADINLTTKMNLATPIEIAADNRDFGIFKILLNKYQPLSSMPKGLLSTVMKHIYYKLGYCNEIVRILQNADSNVVFLKINETDNDNNTLLHYALRQTDQNVIEQLLSLGASLGARNRNGVMPIQDIDPDTLEKHLDKCITFNLMEKQMDKENFTVTFNYRTIIPPYYEESRNNDANLEAAELNLTLKKNRLAESEVIFFMSKSSEYKHLLKHPVIVSFLFMKWHRIQRIFWTNFFFYACFAISLITYIFTDYAQFSQDKSTIHNVFAKLFYVFLVITLIVLILKKLFQIYIDPRDYVTNFENYLEVLLIILTAMIVFVNFFSSGTRKQLSSMSILLAAFELILMLGNHPYFSTNVVMLRRVSFNFFKFLMWYSLLIIAFALSFYLLFADKITNTQVHNNITVVSDVTKENATVKNHIDEDNSFYNPVQSVFKTIIMLTGEFDASNINFDEFPITSKLIFTLFIFMIAIILLNLLNGLAVSDIQMIKNDAELIGHIARAQHIRHVETILLGNFVPLNLIQKVSDICWCWPIRRNWNYKLGQPLAENQSLFPKYLNYELTFYPNKDGLIDLYAVDENGIPYKKSLSPCLTVYLDQETIKRTNTIIKAKEDEELNQIYNKKFQEHFETLQMTTDKIQQTQEFILAKLTLYHQKKANQSSKFTKNRYTILSSKKKKIGEK